MAIRALGYEDLDAIVPDEGPWDVRMKPGQAAALRVFSAAGTPAARVPVQWTAVRATLHDRRGKTRLSLTERALGNPVDSVTDGYGISQVLTGKSMAATVIGEESWQVLPVLEVRAGEVRDFHLPASWTWLSFVDLETREPLPGMNVGVHWPGLGRALEGHALTNSDGQLAFGDLDLKVFVSLEAEDPNVQLVALGGTGIYTDESSRLRIDSGERRGPIVIGVLRSDQSFLLKNARTGLPVHAKVRVTLRRPEGEVPGKEVDRADGPRDASFPYRSLHPGEDGRIVANRSMRLNFEYAQRRGGA